jgi:predicted HTH transcriptional regulator
MSAKEVEGTSVESLNKNSFHSYRDYLKRMITDSKYNAMDDETFLKKLQIVKNGKLTYGGLLFMGDNMSILDNFPDFRVDYLEIPGTSYANAEPRYTFRMAEQENLWEYYFALFQRLQLYADNPLYIGEMGGGYENTKQMEALREGLINMLIHCDYFSPMKPRIRVFTNRIEFENPGTLPRPLEELMNEDTSVPRNPVLAKLFRAAKFCESAGYGFDKMLEWKKETHNEVIFETSIDKTKFTFIIDTEEVVTENIEQDVTENVTENVTEDVTENRLNLIVEWIKLNNRISTSEIAKKLNVTRMTIHRDLEKLKSLGILERIGADKGGYWKIIQ